MTLAYRLFQMHFLHALPIEVAWKKASGIPNHATNGEYISQGCKSLSWSGLHTVEARLFRQPFSDSFSVIYCLLVAEPISQVGNNMKLDWVWYNQQREQRDTSTEQQISEALDYLAMLSKGSRVVSGLYLEKQVEKQRW